MRGGISLVEKTVDLEVEKAYLDLKKLLIEKEFKIVDDEAPTLISVEQGSLWGISPLTAKKKVNYRLESVDSGTLITYSSSLASDWKNLTIIGSAISMVVALLCLWISMDLDAIMTTQKESYWSWIAIVDGYIDVHTVQILSGLTKILTVFLAIILIAEVVTVIYVHSRINTLAEVTLNAL